MVHRHISDVDLLARSTSSSRLAESETTIQTHTSSSPGMYCSTLGSVEGAICTTRRGDAELSDGYLSRVSGPDVSTPLLRFGPRPVIIL